AEVPDEPVEKIAETLSGPPVGHVHGEAQTVPVEPKVFRFASEELAGGERHGRRTPSEVVAQRRGQRGEAVARNQDLMRPESGSPDQLEVADLSGHGKQERKESQLPAVRTPALRTVVSGVENARRNGVEEPSAPPAARLGVDLADVRPACFSSRRTA